MPIWIAALLSLASYLLGAISWAPVPLKKYARAFTVTFYLLPWAIWLAWRTA